MNDNGLTASDVALLTGSNNGGAWGGEGGWGSMIWLFAILALMGGGFGGNWGGNGYHPQYATQDFVQNGMNFNSLIDQNRDIMNAITSGTAQTVAAAKEAEYESIAVAKDIQATIISQIGDVRTNQMQLLANQNDCCCRTQQLVTEVGNNILSQIAQNRYENAMNTAAINANTTAQTQRILDAYTGNQIQELRDQVQALQLQSQLAGVVRYPNGWTYNAGNSPFCNNNYCCGNNM